MKRPRGAGGCSESGGVNSISDKEMETKTNVDLTGCVEIMRVYVAHSHSLTEAAVDGR
eukprot:CAMPEP_0198204248 /NCGR_PEP_ID=MMETSP1445-20131203/7652_1 /TAXON_ID=36898 /ORGANISM="Pyramimonas sp., Strain CCMP2087" /LENGTH=57 /DNA_ID=CAMNT_0043876037 /DNA_START=86 /DNA_END=255 /DNA_ORIENTATION=+